MSRGTGAGSIGRDGGHGGWHMGGTCREHRRSHDRDDRYGWGLGVARRAARLRAEATAAALDAVLIAAGYCFVMLVRTLGEATPTQWADLLHVPARSPCVLTLAAAWAFGLYAQIWRHASVAEARRVLGAGLTSAGLVTGVLPRRRPAVPAQRQHLRRDGRHRPARCGALPVPAVRLQPAPGGHGGSAHRGPGSRRCRRRAGAQHAPRPARRPAARGHAGRRPAHPRPVLRRRAGGRVASTGSPR